MRKKMAVHRDRALAAADRAEQTLQILHERVDELSSRLSTAIPATNAEVPRSFASASSVSAASVSAASVSAASVSAEVSRAFGRQPSRASEASSSGSASFSSAGQMSRYRRMTNMRRISGKKHNNKAKKVKTFERDLILLPGPKSTSVPRQSAKYALVVHGHELKACPFDTAMNEVQVEAAIVEAFGDRIPPGTDIEIVESVYTKLAKPQLAQEQRGIDGNLLCRLFKNKPVYIKPNKQLLLDAQFMDDDDDKDHKQIDYEVGSGDDPESRKEEEDLPQMLSDSGSTNKSSTGTPQSTRVICERCHHTFPLGESCIICTQNVEYQQSLMNDAGAQSQTATQETEEQPVNELQQAVLRQRRLTRLGLVSEESTVEQEYGATPSTADVTPAEDIPDLPLPEPEILKVRRIQIRKDLIEHFKEPSILDRPVEFQIINERSLPEEGAGVGVTREVYSLFWNEFSNSMTIGERERVPFVRHDCFIKEWEAVGRIFVKGYTSVKYFPVFLSKAFICFCLFGTVTDDLYLSSFKKYLSQLEEDQIEEILKSDDLPDQEFKDFLERFECRSLVKREHVPNILLEISKQELIQKPHVMIAAWQPILRQGLQQFEEFQSPSALLEFYAALSPTPKKVLDSLSSNPANEAERNVFKFLQRFVRGLDSAQLVKFLCFTTAADVMGAYKIQVSFVETEGFSSRPIAHTCGPLLVLPSTYNNFVEFREEFTNILKHDIEINIR